MLLTTTTTAGATSTRTSSHATSRATALGHGWQGNDQQGKGWLPERMSLHAQ